MYLKMAGFAALTLLTISCVQNEILENQVPSNAITFANLNDRISSRAANDDDDDYGIYAYLNEGSPAASAWFMDNQQVDGDDNSYSPLKYWPIAGNLDFYAYAPYGSGNIDASGITWSATTPVFDITYTVPAAANEDFTIATPVTGANSGQVQLKFSHMLSKLDFSAELTDDLSNDGFVLTLDSVAVKVKSNEGNILLNKPGDDWTSLVNAATTYTGANSYMIMPQPAPDTEITLSVSITHNEEDYFIGKSLKTYVLNISDLADFVKGNKYLFKVTVGDTTHDEGDDPVFNVISFKAETNPWADGGDIELTNP